jgi:hypothetical protein
LAQIAGQKWKEWTERARGGCGEDGERKRRGDEDVLSVSIRSSNGEEYLMPRESSFRVFYMACSELFAFNGGDECVQSVHFFK